ncbi:MAG: AraC family transcriptional regulator [Clostridiales bacterium]|jgi:predicted transcriptional regulator|nr:AraC family transcriptional regulator [Clostridiales bacterium]
MNKTVKELSEILEAEVVAGAGGLSGVVTDVYICDLLSWVMGRAPAESIWITIQGHVNIIAVAALAEIYCIVVAEGAEIAPETIAKANEQDIVILKSDKSAYELAGKLCNL